MTDWLYYTEQTLQAFEAVVQRCAAVDDRFHVELDRSAFYPSSGGQPFDMGWLDDARVHDVFEREDGTVVHVVERPFTAGVRVRGRIESARRFDHMQQHTGQHVLSAAFEQGVGVRTASVHMGTVVSTIDLERDVSVDECRRAETDANRVVWENRLVHVRLVSAADAAALPLRKASQRTGTLRLVDIEGYDLSACGGTHVARTGAVGLIVITGLERAKGATRVSFACGGRALESHRQLRDVVQAATRVLSVPADDVVTALTRTREEGRAAARAVRSLHGELSRYRARDALALAETIGPYRVVLSAEPALDAGALKGFASAVVSDARVIAACTGAGSPVPVVIACGRDVTVDAAAVLKDVVAVLGGRGGGTANMAQGGVSAGADAILHAIRGRLQQVVSGSGP